METCEDFSEWLTLLNEHHVEYVIADAHALGFHGAPRYTGDIDVYVRPTPENAARLIDALGAFGFEALDLTEENFSDPNRVIQLGYPPLRIDIVTSISGVAWDEASGNAASGHYGDIPVRYLGRQELIANKRACGRLKDLADIEALGES